MAIREYAAAFTHRSSVYVFGLIGLALAAGFLYAFNFTALFGAVSQ